MDRSGNEGRKEFFDERAVEWDQHPVKGADRIEELIASLELKGNESILDVATGIGILIPFYEKHITSGKVTGIDFSDKMVEIAKKRHPKEEHPNIEFVLQDIYDMKYESEFDIAMCYSCFPHFSDKPGAISLIARALKKGGRFVISHINVDRVGDDCHMGKKGSPIEHDHMPSRDDVKKMIADAGLKLTSMRNDRVYMLISEKV